MSDNWNPHDARCDKQQKNHPYKTEYQPIVLIGKQMDFFSFIHIIWSN